MRLVAFVIMLAISSLPLAAEEAFTLATIDTSLAEIAKHAKQYPMRFTSQAQRQEIEIELQRVLRLLDAAALSYPNDPDILFRDAFANAMGHNFDYPGCAEKAIQRYERLLTLEPENRVANYYYGAFLSGTTLFDKSIPYLTKAAGLGEAAAHYALAFVYVKQGDLQKALPEFKEYLKSDPENAVAKEMVSEIESGTASVRIVNKRPPEAQLFQIPGVSK